MAGVEKPYFVFLSCFGCVVKILKKLVKKYGITTETQLDVIKNIGSGEQVGNT